MPIPRKNFDAKIGPISKAVLELLASDPNSAFSFEEVVNYVRAQLGESAAKTVDAVNQLVKTGYIDGRTLDGTWYGSIHRDATKKEASVSRGSGL